MKTKLLPWLLMCGCAVFFALEANAAGVQPAGMIKAARVNGTVTMTNKATRATMPVVANAEISQGAVVTTTRGASVVLAFSNGATINLGSDSELDIEQFTQDPFSSGVNLSSITQEPTTSTTKLKLTHGELVSKVAKLNAARGSTFAVATPVGAAGIRGTTFRIVYRIDAVTGKAQFSLTTLEGNVTVTLASGTVNTPPVDVTAGTEVAVTADIDASGNVTITLPAGTTTMVATNTPAATTAEINASANAIAQAVANVVITPPPPATRLTPPEPLIQPINRTVVSPSQ
jgi:hypothetical protein